ncbi:MAG: hypothetical protein LBS56_00220, partial [Propionibacteriaceae bacterium]|nr:hypothetical protein [Propionibacteriaceae bacterium]
MHIWFWVSLGVLCLGGAVASLARGPGGRVSRRGRVATPFRVFVGAVAAAIYVLMLPVVRGGTAADVRGWENDAVATLYATWQVFAANADMAGALDGFRDATDLLSRAEALYTVVLFAVAPVMGVAFVLTFFQAFSAHIRYWLRRRHEVDIFSELNDRSIALARSLKKERPKAVIVFTDVIQANNEPSVELIGRARQLGAICFKGDILSLPLQRHSPSARMRFFVMGSQEEENVWHAASIMEDRRYRDRRKTDLYLFSDTAEGKLALRYRNCQIHVRRVDPARSLVYHWLWQGEGDKPAGLDLFRRAVPDEDGKSVNAAVVGLGGHGLEMVKALSWYCQMDGPDDVAYRLRLDAFDQDPAAAGTFARDYPGLASQDHDGPSPRPGRPREDALHAIRVHGGVDARTPDLMRGLVEADERHELSFVFISLGDDGLNLQVATDIRREFARRGRAPDILAVSRNSRAVLGGLARADEEVEANLRKRNRSLDSLPRIRVIGDVEDVYSYDCVVRSEVELNGLVCHLKWATDVRTTPQYVKQFWSDEYHYRSSICVPIHWRARRALGVPGADPGRRGAEQKEALSRL